VHTGAKARSNDDRGSRPPSAIESQIEIERPGPFAWQSGRRLWILDGRDAEWVVAELEFEPRGCRYIEVRRASYRWPREAAGALLGRALSGGAANAEEASRGLALWANRAVRITRNSGA
jgi:hypothetical protein